MLDQDDLSMHIEIGQALARYCHGVDHGQLELALSAYWPEATDQHGGAWDGNGHAFVTDLIERQAAKRAQGFPAPGGLHHMTTTLVERVDENHAYVQSYFMAFQPHDSEGEYQLALVIGRYLDQFERREGDWKILVRRVVNDFSRLDVNGPVWASASWQVGGFIQGGFGADDPGVQDLRRIAQRRSRAS